MKLTPREIERAISILQKVEATQDDVDELCIIAAKFAMFDPFEGAVDLTDGAFMTSEEDQLLRESDERAAFNDRLDNLRYEQ